MIAVLILGGTTEGYALAEVLAKRGGFRVISALAGRTTSPRRPDGEVRIGGFGGAQGLAAYLRESDIAAVVDATHPFAVVIGGHAVVGCATAGVPLLRMERPTWQPVAGDLWTEVVDWGQAAAIVAEESRRVFLTVGRRELAPFAAIPDVWFLIRSVESPHSLPPFPHAETLAARGPFTLEEERALLCARTIDTIVCKNSGGSAVDTKLTAARELGIKVVMRRRPPVFHRGVDTIPEVITWLSTLAKKTGGSGADFGPREILFPEATVRIGDS